jgi:hypothetical protein
MMTTEQRFTFALSRYNKLHAESGYNPDKVSITMQSINAATDRYGVLTSILSLAVKDGYKLNIHDLVNILKSIKRFKSLPRGTTPQFYVFVNDNGTYEKLIDDDDHLIYGLIQVVGLVFNLKSVSPHRVVAEFTHTTLDKEMYRVYNTLTHRYSAITYGILIDVYGDSLTY